MKTVVYFADASPLESPGLFEIHLAKADDARRKKVESCRLDKDKCLSLAADMLLRHALRNAGYEEMPEIALGKHGKPYFSGEPNLHFNIAHSGAQAMVILSEHEVGCDIERIRPGRLRVEKYFREEERVLIDAGKSEREKDESFCRIWTLKESYIKATGLGLALPLDGFSVVVDGEVRLWIDPQSDRSDEGEFRLFEIPCVSGYKAACCVAGEDSPPQVCEVDLRAI